MTMARSNVERVQLYYFNDPTISDQAYGQMIEDAEIEDEIAAMDAERIEWENEQNQESEAA